MKKRYRLSTALGIFAACAVLLSACSFSLAEDITPPPGLSQPVSVSSPVPVSTEALFPLVPPDSQNGAAIYAENCAPCHGETGLGDGAQAADLQNRPAPLGDPQLARSSSPAEWYTMVTRGNMDNFMPPFTSLTDSQRWDVVAYSFSLSTPPEAMAQAGELFQANCASCHGSDGSGTARGSDLTDLERSASRSSADYYQTISQGQGEMSGFEDELSEAERWSLADYTRSLGLGGSSSLVAQATPVPSGTEAEGTATAAADEEPQTAGAGVVRGELINRTGKELPGDLTVTLHAFDNMQFAGTYSTTIAADESFTFENVEMPAGRIYMVSTEYNGAVYGSDIVTVEEGMDEISLSIPIFGTTSDTSALTVDRLHLFFDFSVPDTVQIIELYLISNPTDQTVVPSEEGAPVLTFDLPEGAANLQFQEGAIGGRYVSTPGGFGITEPIRPGMGQHQVLFAYELPYDRGLDYKRQFQLPISAVVVLLPEVGVRVNSDLLVDAGTREVEGETYHMYNSKRIEAGMPIGINLSGAAGGSDLFSGSGPVVSIGNMILPTSLIIGILSVGIVMIVTGILLYRSSKAREEEFEEDESPDEDADEDETVLNLMDSIIALDDMYKEGELAEEAYRQRRTALKERLRKLREQG